MVFDPAVHFGVADNPMKLCLLIDPTAADPKPTTIAEVLDLTDDTVVIGTHFPDDIFRTTFDRYTGIAVDDGRLKSESIPPSELARLERFAAAGAYAVLKQPKPEPAEPAAFDPDASMPATESSGFDPDALMG